LAGCNRYSLGPKGELFEKGFFYDLTEDKARLLLNKADDYGNPYFVRVEAPVEDDEMVVEETISEEMEGVKIKRSRGRPRKNPLIKTSGDTTALEMEDNTPAPALATDAEGIEV
jgi:hypothetical protein